MRIYDISRELFSAPVYPGDPKSSFELLSRMETGDEYNLSTFCACTHAGTHVDAPRHYVFDGKTVEQLDLSSFYGPCSVVEWHGMLTGAQAEQMLPHLRERVLLKGETHAFLSTSAAFVFQDAGIRLVGTDALSIGLGEEEARVHTELLLADIPVLEGLDLSEVTAGDYLLCAFPLKLGGLEAAPVRAVLLDVL